jgi:hypothetical protein
MYPLIVLVHVVAIVIFVAAHAVSAVAIFQVKGEPDRAKLARILNRSASALLIATIAVIVSLIAGIVAGIMGGWWGRLWIWISLVLLVVVGGTMTPLAAIPMGNVRRALGIQVGKPKEGEPPLVALGDAEVSAARAALRPELVAAIGIAGLVIITWLMLAKPF